MGRPRGVPRVRAWAARAAEPPRPWIVRACPRVAGRAGLASQVLCAQHCIV